MSEYTRERFPLPTPGRLRRELRLRRPPWWMVTALIVVIIVTWLPLYGIYRMRTSVSDQPKIHFVHDMDFQPSYGPQDPHGLFADGRATRPHPSGTVARGHLRLDDHYYRGYRVQSSSAGVEAYEFMVGLPEQIELTNQLIERGSERYGIYCAICHADDGLGQGVIHQRAMALKESKWVPPTNLMTQEMRDRADGQIFQAISDGVRNMPSYNTQIPVADRWAVVAYLRELQHNSPVSPPTNPGSTNQ